MVLVGLITRYPQGQLIWVKLKSAWLYCVFAEQDDPPKPKPAGKQRTRHEKTVFDAADADLGNTRLREAASKAAQIWYDRTANIRLIDADLADFPDGPDLRKGAAEGIASLTATITEKSARVSEADESIAALAVIIADNPADPEMEAMATELTVVVS